MKLIRYLCLSCILTTFSGIGADETQALIPEEVYASPEYRLAAEFMRRYTKLAIGPKSYETDSLLKKAYEDGMRFETGKPSDLAHIPMSASFGIKFDGLSYSLSWSDNDHIIANVTFPANIQLMSFKDKYSLDNDLVDRLRNSNSKEEIKVPAVKTSDMIEIPYSECKIFDRGFFITPSLRHQISYVVTNGASKSDSLLLDFKRYPLETVGNIMLTGCSPVPLKVNIVLNGKKRKEHLQTEFTSLFNEMTEEGCFPYWGIDKFDGENIEGVYVWINKYGGYAHVLTINTTLEELGKGNSSLNAKMTGHIRLDNLKSLIEEL